MLAALAGCALPHAAEGPARQLASPAATLVEGNHARLLVDGPQAHSAMFDAMAAARSHISLEVYILDDGEPGERLASRCASSIP